MSLEKHVEEFFKRTRKFWNIWELQKKFNVVDKSKMLDILNGLEEKGIVYGEEDSYVYVIEDSVLKFGVLKKSNKKNYYVELKNHMKVLLDKEDVRNLGALEGDYVFVLLNSFRCTKKHYDTGIIKKVVKKSECLAKYIIKTRLEKDSSNQQYYFYYHGKKFFLRGHKLNGAFAGDCIGVEICEESGKMTAKVVEVLERKKPCKEFIKKNGEWRSIENPNYVGVLDKDSYKEDTRILANYSYVNGVFQLEFVKEISNKLWDVVLDMAQFYDFSLPDNTKNFSALDSHERRDLRDLKTFTIDPVQAKDLDDAVSLSKEGNLFHLGVHIADVSNYVQYNSALDREALKRGTSVYLVDRVIPMLPQKLSNGICSLNAGEDRLALSCLMDIDEKGKVVSHGIAETVIHVNERMTYTDVKKILQKEDEKVSERYKELLPMFFQMEELSALLRKRRKKRGAIDFDFPESKVELDENGKPVRIYPYEQNVATGIIEDFMLAANETVAQEYAQAELPFVYRTHENPDMEKVEPVLELVHRAGVKVKKSKEEIRPKEVQKILKELEGKESEAFFSRLILRSMKQAKYTTECTGHFGLAARYYCHFTSPIRRYPDLQIHRIIKENLRGKMTEAKIRHYQEILDEVARQSSAMERRAEEAERETIKMKKAEYMESQIGQVYEGIISGVTDWGFYVELENTVEGLVHVNSLTDDYYIYDNSRYTLTGEKKKKSFAIGQKVKVRVAQADAGERTVDFVLAD